MTRNRLMSAALTCFENHGYGDTTVEDVVAEAEVARGTFYLHFTNKLELVRALTDEVQPGVGVLYDRLDEMLANPDRKAIQAWMTEAFTWFVTHRTIVMVWQELAVSEPGFVGVSPYFTADHMPRYLSQWPKRLRTAARMRVVLLVQQLHAAFQLSHVSHLVTVSDDVLIDVLTDLWHTALANPEAGSARAAARAN